MGTLIEEQFPDFALADEEPGPIIGEVVTIDCLFVTACAVHVDYHTAQLTGWVYLPRIDPGALLSGLRCR
jgi:hypothetical protein